MKRLLEFKEFESLSGLSEDQKAWLDRCTRGSWSVGGEGIVNVQGDFDCSHQNLGGFKGVRFRGVSGYFHCGGNNLTTLEGAPDTVGDGFYCNYNNLTTLEGAPKVVDGHFYCDGNKLVTLEGAPETVEGSFYSDSMQIPEGQWGISGWLKVLEEGEPKAQKLIATLISPEALNKRLEESPETTMVSLKSVWNSPVFAKIRSQLRIPKGYEDEMNLMGDLDDIGL
jgi:hypothetical protein